MEDLSDISERSSLVSSSSSLTSSSFLETKTATLRRSVGYPQLFAYVVGTLIGSGVYVSPGLVAKYSSNMAIALIIWIVSGMVCLFGALCFCELAISLKKTGGYYIYIKETYGDLAGFISVWTTELVISPAGLAVVSVAIGEHIVGAFTDITSPNGIWMVKGISTFCMLLSCTINIAGVSLTNNAQQFLSLMQILSMVFFIIVGIWKGATDGVQNYSQMFVTNGTIDYNSLSVAIYSALWSYDGWGVIVSATEELTNAEKDLWLAIVTGIPFVIICYVSINLAFMSVLSHAEMASSPIVASKFIQKSLGGNYAFIVPIMVATNCFGSLNAIYFFISRSMLSAAREGHLPEPLSYIHKERRTPVIALIFSLFLSLVWIFSLGSGTGILITYFSFAVWVIYGVALSATIVLRIRQPDLPRPFKVWIVNPVFMCLVSLYLVLAPFFKRPVECGVCLAILLLSIPVYFLVVRGPTFIPSSMRRYKEVAYKFILHHLNLVVCVYVEEGEENQSQTARHGTSLIESDEL